VRTLKRALSVACVTTLAVPLWAGPVASADPVTTTEAASSGAYFSRTGIAKPDASPQAPPNVISDRADGVAAGNLAVAAAGGEDDKISFLFFSLTDVPFGSTISKAVLTVPLAPSDANNVQVAAEPAKVRACKNGPEGFGGDDGVAIALAPTKLCDEFSATAEASADGSAYVIDISGLAADWPDLNDGVGLYPNEGATTTPFQVVFQSADKATLEYEFTAPAEVEVPVPTDTTGGSVTVVDTPTSTTPDTTTFDPGTLGSGVATSDLGGSLAPVSTPIAAGELPTAPEPQTAGAGAVATSRAAAELPTEVLTPTASFWLMALLLAGGLVFLALVLGDPRSPASAAATRPTRLSRALAARQRGGAPASLLTRSS
jgi:hypothetical protein